MRTLKFALASLLFVFANLSTFSQAAFILPSPTAANDLVKLFIDVNQTSGGLKTILNSHPEAADSVYLWSWEPVEPLALNGSWGNSNDALLLVNEGNLLYSITFYPSVFYGVDGPIFFSKGISCLAKLKNGNAYGADAVGEAKTEDLHVVVIPKLCDELYCEFPLNAKREDFISFTYDNNQETNPALQSLGADDVYLYLRADYDNFGNGVEVASQSNVPLTPALKLHPVVGMPGFFRITILVESLFNIPATQDIMQLRYFVLRPGYVYTTLPPFQAYTFQDCQD